MLAVEVITMRKIDLRRDLEVWCTRPLHIFPMPMHFLAWDNEGRGWAIYGCASCDWKAGFALEKGRVVMKFGSPYTRWRVRSGARVR